MTDIEGLDKFKECFDIINSIQISDCNCDYYIDKILGILSSDSFSNTELSDIINYFYIDAKRLENLKISISDLESILNDKSSDIDTIIFETKNLMERLYRFSVDNDISSEEVLSMSSSLIYDVVIKEEVYFNDSIYKELKDEKYTFLRDKVENEILDHLDINNLLRISNQKEIFSLDNVGLLCYQYYEDLCREQYKIFLEENGDIDEVISQIDNDNTNFKKNIFKYRLRLFFTLIFPFFLPIGLVLLLRNTPSGSCKYINYDSYYDLETGEELAEKERTFTNDERNYNAIIETHGDWELDSNTNTYKRWVTVYRYNNDSDVLSNHKFSMDEIMNLEEIDSYIQEDSSITNIDEHKIIIQEKRQEKNYPNLRIGALFFNTFNLLFQSLRILDKVINSDDCSLNEVFSNLKNEKIFLKNNKKLLDENLEKKHILTRFPNNKK